MRKRWLLITGMVLFDGFISHYRSIFFGAPIREGNPINSYLLHKLGINALFFLMPAIIVFFWLIVKLGSKLVFKIEKRYENIGEAENVILNAMIIAYSSITLSQILMLVSLLFNFQIHLLQFKWLVVASAVGVLVYSIYEDFRLKKKNLRKRSSSK